MELRRFLTIKRFKSQPETSITVTGNFTSRKQNGDSRVTVTTGSPYSSGAPTACNSTLSLDVFNASKADLAADLKTALVSKDLATLSKQSTTIFKSDLPNYSSETLVSEKAESHQPPNRLLHRAKTMPADFSRSASSLRKSVSTKLLRRKTDSDLEKTTLKETEAALSSQEEAPAQKKPIEKYIATAYPHFNGYFVNPKLPCRDVGCIGPMFPEQFHDKQTGETINLNEELCNARNYDAVGNKLFSHKESYSESRPTGKLRIVPPEGVHNNSHPKRLTPRQEKIEALKASLRTSIDGNSNHSAGSSPFRDSGYSSPSTTPSEPTVLTLEIPKANRHRRNLSDVSEKSIIPGQVRDTNVQLPT